MVSYYSACRNPLAIRKPNRRNSAPSRSRERSFQAREQTPRSQRPLIAHKRGGAPHPRAGVALGLQVGDCGRGDGYAPGEATLNFRFPFIEKSADVRRAVLAFARCACGGRIFPVGHFKTFFRLSIQHS
jgi:hypothetical protein